MKKVKKTIKKLKKKVVKPVEKKVVKPVEKKVEKKEQVVKTVLSDREKELRDKYVGKKVGVDKILKVVDKKVNKVELLFVSMYKGTTFLISKEGLDSEIITD